MPTTQSPVIVILGATGGVGAALSKQLVASSYAVVLGARDEAALAQCSAERDDAAYKRVDARCREEVDACVELALQTYGRLDGLVNCVGTFGLKPLHLVTDEEFDEDLAVNLKSSFFATRAAVQRMDKTRGGSIVLLSSAAARHGMPNHESIAAAKAGVLGLMLSAAATYARSNIRINAVAPGLIETKLTRSITGNALMAKASAGMHALGRFGQAEQVARVIAFLLNAENDFITGQVFGIDGGLATLRPTRG